MYFKQFYLGCLAHASYLIGSAGEAVVVDPQRDVAQYIREAEAQGLTIKFVIETHLHADFVSGHRELAKRTGAEIVFGWQAGAQFQHRAARDGDELQVGQLRLRILETPGHTPESISVLVIEDGVPVKVLTGDTLFIGDVGRPDLVGSKGYTPEKLAAIREAEQRAACRVLGVRECVFLGYPDGFTLDEHEFRGQIVRLLRQYRPDVVITWDAFRGTFNHRDHRTVGTVTSDAIYPLVRDRLFYPAHEDDGLESHQVNEVLLAGADKPDYVVDITAHWETKIEAIVCHASQVNGRTKEDFVKEREEREKENPGQPIEERFRRWSIRRPARAQAAPAGAAGGPGAGVHAVAKGQKGKG